MNLNHYAWTLGYVCIKSFGTKENGINPRWAAVVILFFAVYLTLIGTGGRWVLDNIGFYDVVETEPTVPTVSEMVVDLPASEAETEASSEG